MQNRKFIVDYIQRSADLNHNCSVKNKPFTDLINRICVNGLTQLITAGLDLGLNTSKWVDEFSEYVNSSYVIDSFLSAFPTTNVNEIEKVYFDGLQSCYGLLLEEVKFLAWEFDRLGLNQFLNQNDGELTSNASVELLPRNGGYLIVFNF